VSPICLPVQTSVRQRTDTAPPSAHSGFAAHRGIEPSTNRRGNTMNEDTVKGDWKQMTGKLKEKWGKLTDDDLKQAKGKREVLLGKLQEHYGLVKEQAEADLKTLGYV
jgi:uncharacterized protein YjbJ (UPF0337 family)